MAKTKTAAAPESPDSTTGARADEDVAARWVSIAQLMPWSRNPRKNDDNAVRVAKVIIRLGFGAPLIAREENSELIAGHARLKASGIISQLWAEATDRERATWHPDAVRVATRQQVPCRHVDLSERDAHLHAMADNRLNELSPWDSFEVQQILSDYDIDDASLAGWSSADLDKMASELLGGAGSGGDDDAPDEFPEYGDDIPTNCVCPKCGYEWSDSSKGKGKS